MKDNPGKIIGDTNRARVRVLLRECPGISNREIAQRLSLSEFAVGRHIAVIRAEWITPANGGLDVDGATP